MKKKLVFVEGPDREGTELENAVAFGLSRDFDVRIISDLLYLETFFREEQTLDVLLVDEEFYGEYLSRHNIGKIFVLTPECELTAEGPEAQAVPADMEVQALVELIGENSEERED